MTAPAGLISTELLPIPDIELSQNEYWTMLAREVFHLLAPAHFPVQMEISARCSDLDPLRHVNNVAVADIFAEGRNALIHAFFKRSNRPANVLFIVGQVGITYIGEAHYPGIFKIAGGVLSVGRSSFRVGQAFFHEGRCTSVAETVLIATAGHRATELNQASLEALSEFLVDESRFPASWPEPPDLRSLIVQHGTPTAAMATTQWTSSASTGYLSHDR